MKSEFEIRKELARIRQDAKIFDGEIRTDAQAMITVLKWVLDEEK